MTSLNPATLDPPATGTPVHPTTSPPRRLPHFSSENSVVSGPSLVLYSAAVGRVAFRDHGAPLTSVQRPRPLSLSRVKFSSSSRSVFYREDGDTTADFTRDEKTFTATRAMLDRDDWQRVRRYGDRDDWQRVRRYGDRDDWQRVRRYGDRDGWQRVCRYAKCRGQLALLLTASCVGSKVSRSVSDVSVLPGKASSLINKKIDKLDEKRRQQIHKHKNNNLVKSIFRKSTSIKSKEKERYEGVDPATAASQEFDAFLKTLSKEGGGAIRKQVSVCVDKLRRSLQTQSLEQTADLLQDLYTNLHSMVTNHHSFAGLSDDDVVRVVVLTERYVCTRLHAQLRGAVNAACEDQDLSTQDRIRHLNWVSAEMLESKLDDEDDAMAPTVDLIIGELLELDGKAVASDKLTVLVSVSHQIMQALTTLTAAPAAADDFLPALIFCLIRANPPLLHSNITYITNFAPRHQLESGETGYYFTNLCCAVAFIEKVCGASLSLTEEEFSRHMKGSGLTRHPKPPPSVTALANSLHRFSRAADNLTAINASYNDMIQQMEELKTSVTQKAEEVVQENPCVHHEPYSTSRILQLMESRQHHLLHLLQQLSQDDSLPAEVTAATEEPSRSTATLPECEEAFNLYYSLEDFMSQDTSKLSSAQQPRESSTQSGALRTVPSLSGSGASLLDEPVPDNTLSLLDQSSSSYINVNSSSVYEQSNLSLRNSSPSSLFDGSLSFNLQKSSSSFLDETPASSSDGGPASLLDEPVTMLGSSSLLPLPEYSGFRDQSNRIPSIPCDTGPASLGGDLRKDSGPASYLSFSMTDKELVHKSSPSMNLCEWSNSDTSAEVSKDVESWGVTTNSVPEQQPFAVWPDDPVSVVQQEDADAETGGVNGSPSDVRDSSISDVDTRVTALALSPTELTSLPPPLLPLSSSESQQLQ
ncbi:uncharacterized protein LOC125178138 [Hyalella azteca]|uniref:Uncharacterized protein LOC125178138 n=1 Tax=Hyalella azteca TaxID=294128 RepID=A0A979FKH0_HYAAZ|nr:uncharacterized protein LOC125178138 [Hyalella azteca]